MDVCVGSRQARVACMVDAAAWKYSQGEDENRSIAAEGGRGRLDRKGERGAQGRIGHFGDGDEDWESDTTPVSTSR